MSYEFYKVLHLISLAFLVGLSSWGFGYRKTVGSFIGNVRKRFIQAYMVVLLVFLVSGFGLLHKLGYVDPLNMPVEFVVKILVWFALGFYPTILVSGGRCLVNYSSILVFVLIFLNIYLGVYWKAS